MYANAERPSSKDGGCGFESRRAYSMGYGGTGRPARLWTERLSWFEARYPSHAAAHGCGPAFVRRVIRVGTGWRLCGPGGQPGVQVRIDLRSCARPAIMRSWRNGRRASSRCWCREASRFKSGRAHFAPGSGDPVPFVGATSGGRHLAGAHGGRLLCWQGPPGFDPGLATLVRLQPGQHMIMPFGSASTSPWYGGTARLDTGEGLVTVVSAVSTPAADRDLAVRHG